MVWQIASFLAQAVGISLSGVMAPGPVTAAAIAAGARNKHAGFWIAIGHGIVEFPLMGLIMGGAGVVLAARAFRVGIGLAGGAVLVAMGVAMLVGLRKGAAETSAKASAGPLWTGVVLSLGNPYFLVWWATVGLALATRAMELGVLAFGLFAIVHWLCDLVWLEALSLAARRGTSVLGRTSGWLMPLLCALVMGFFGAMFLIDAIREAVR